MSRTSVRRWLYAALLLVFLLHNDFWLWDDAGLIGGMPVGLVYHIGYCLVVALLMALLVGFAWPEDLDPGRRGKPGA